jgi:hypothetical protein
MNIEFYTPASQVKEWVINYIKEQLIELHNRNKIISRAEVYFRDQNAVKICEVELSIYGNSISVQRSADKYENAAREVVKELTAKMEEQAKMRNEPPDEITSTIKV